MTKINVDYEKLNNATVNADTAEGQAAGIVSRINSIYGGLDSRVQSKVSGLETLSSEFDKIKVSLLNFSENMMNTIYQIQWLEEEQSNVSFIDKLSLATKQYDSILGNEEFLKKIFYDLVSKKFSEEEINKIITGEVLSKTDELYQYQNVYKFLIEDSNNVFYDFETADGKLSDNISSFIGELLENIAEEDCKNYNAQYPSEIALIYANIAANNPIIRFEYSHINKTATADGFSELVTIGNANCINFLKWSYYQGFSQVYKDEPEKLQEVEKRLKEIEIGGMGKNALINPKFYGMEEGSYEIKHVAAQKEKNPEIYQEEIDNVTNMLQPGDVIATEKYRPDDKPVRHVRLVKEVDYENKTVTCLESSGEVGIYEKTYSIETSVINRWSTHKNDHTVIIKSDKFMNYLIDGIEENIPYKNYNSLKYNEIQK